jgi:hypothetical protein
MRRAARLFLLAAAVALGGTSVWLSAAPREQGGAANQTAQSTMTTLPVSSPAGAGPRRASG